MNIVLLGAGSRARELARLCVLAGEDVNLHETDATAVMDSIDAVEQQLDQGDGEGDGEHRVVDRLEGTTDLATAVADADVVVDTTCRESGELQERFAELEELLDRETLVATAVPGVSVTAAAAGLRHPDRAVGFRLHDSDEPFVEVVLAEQTDADAAAHAEEFAGSVAPEWVAVRDTPGGVSTRLSLALEVAAIRMVDEGAAGVEAVDAAFRAAYGTDVGPLERADRAGLDERRAALLSLSERLGSRFEPPPLLTARVEAGQTGADAGEGFYAWEDGEPRGSALADPATPSDGDEPAERT